MGEIIRWLTTVRRTIKQTPLENCLLPRLLREVRGSSMLTRAREQEGGTHPEVSGRDDADL